MPSGLQSIPSTQSVRLASVVTVSPVSGFQMMQAPLLSTVATRVPSGFQATPITNVVRAADRGTRVAIASAVSGFQTAQVPLSLAVATRAPSGLHATPSAHSV
nr:hypothetical protein [[Pseudopropionibacterium] massiliense]